MAKDENLEEGIIISAAMAEEMRLKSHWKIRFSMRWGATIYTVSNPSLMVCSVGFAQSDKGSGEAATVVAARIVKTHNDVLINPDAAKVRKGAREFLESVRFGIAMMKDEGTGGGKGVELCRDHIETSIKIFSEIINFRKGE